MFVGTQGFRAALVFIVPDPQSLVISTAHNVLSSRVHKNPTHPVIMANLNKTFRIQNQGTFTSVLNKKTKCFVHPFTQQQQLASPKNIFEKVYIFENNSYLCVNYKNVIFGATSKMCIRCLV